MLSLLSALPKEIIFQKNTDTTQAIYSANTNFFETGFLKNYNGYYERCLSSWFEMITEFNSLSHDCRLRCESHRCGSHRCGSHLCDSIVRQTQLSTTMEYEIFFHLSPVISFVNSIIIWLAPRAGKMSQILRCDWLPKRARWS